MSGDEATDDTVCAVVVTHNRRELLRECLARIGNGSRVPDHVIVVDNDSSDGTGDMLAERKDVEVIPLDTNTGGAGGFARGVERAHAAGYEWIWLLDDDTFPEEGCLAALVEGSRRAPRRPTLMASVVRWRDFSLHPMNRPWLRVNRRPEFAQAAGAGLALIRTATFVSILLHRDAVTQHGLPPAHYFVSLEDMQYTGLVLREGAGYMVPESVALHWTPNPYDTVTDTRDRFYLKVRNHLWLLRGPSFRGLEWVGYATSLVGAVLIYLRRSPDRTRALRTVARGLRDGLGREPA